MGKMMLKCELSDADRLRISAQQTATIKARELVEVQKKAAMAGFNETLKEHRVREHDLNESLLSGSELRDVDVETRKDPLSGKEETWRLDTNERIRTADIDPDERQVLMSLPNPGAIDIGSGPDATDEQRDASTPEEAEALRAERLAGERAERISAGVTEARERIHVVGDGTEPDAPWVATLQYGNVVLTASKSTAAEAADDIAQQVVALLEAAEDEAAAAQPTWEEVVAASKAEQDRQELESLAKAQAEDDKATKKRTLKVGAGDGLKNGGLKAPRKKKGLTVALPDGRTVDPEQEAAANEGETPVPGDDAPVATGEGANVDPETGLAF